MDMPPLTLTTSGGLYFVLIPAVGYTLVDGVTTMVAATAILIIVVSVYRARRRWYIVIACVAVGQPIFARLCLALATLRGLNHSLTEEQCRHDLSHRIKVKHKDEGPFAVPAVLSAAEAAAAADTLLASPQKFVHVVYPMPFFTVGAYHEYHKERNRSAPADGVLNYAVSYGDAADLLRPWLDRTFPLVYDRLRATLARELGQPIEWMEPFNTRMGRPGFHVLFPHAAASLRVFHLHSDSGQLDGLRTRESLKLRLSLCEAESMIAFTLPIRMPSARCGLRTISTAACERDPPRCTACAEERVHEYEVGTLYWHSGHVVHQVLEWPFRHADAATPRITLQGFGLRCNGTYRLYW